MNEIRISLFELLKSISNAQDLISPLLSNHQQQVAYLSYQLARTLGLPKQEQCDVFFAGLIHDIGALSRNQRLEIIETESIKNSNHHALIGAKLLAQCTPIQRLAPIVKYHHLRWDESDKMTEKGKEVPFVSHIIHLADRVCAMMKKEENILGQVAFIRKKIQSYENTIFSEKIIRALDKVAQREALWFDLISDNPVDKIKEAPFYSIFLEIDDVMEITLLFSHIIDFRSRFTARHSAGVANIAAQLAKLAGFSALECKKMLIAGYLHDIGKLAVSNDILEKAGKLSEKEFYEVRSHTYYTYYLLDSIHGFEEMKEWAAYHHERLDGKGYPFHKKTEELSKGARIMAVADVFTAITEERPYRKGMADEQAIRVLNHMVEGHALDRQIVKLLIDHLQMIKKLREKSQREATITYRSFLE